MYIDFGMAVFNGLGNTS